MEQGVQFVSEVLGSARQRTSLAPAQARTIVGADSRGPGHVRLHPTAPGRRPIARSGIDHHRRTARANAVDVETIPAHVDHLTWSGIRSYIGGFCPRLVECPWQHQSEEDRHYSTQPDEAPTSSTLRRRDLLRLM